MIVYTPEQERTLNRIELGEGFSLAEFECPCCQTVRLDARLLSLAQAIRSAIDHPLIVNGAFYCEAFNASIEGSSMSHHVRGWAANLYDPMLTVGALKDVAIKMMRKLLTKGRIGTYSGQRVVHVSVETMTATEGIELFIQHSDGTFEEKVI